MAESSITGIGPVEREKGKRKKKKGKRNDCRLPTALRMVIPEHHPCLSLPNRLLKFLHRGIFDILNRLEVG